MKQWIACLTQRWTLLAVCVVSLALVSGSTLILFTHPPALRHERLAAALWHGLLLAANLYTLHLLLRRRAKP